MKNSKAVYPGSFDPLTLGHTDIIRRLSQILGEVVVLIAHSPEKNHLFTSEERKKLAQEELKDLKNVRVEVHQGLTVDYLKSQNITTLVRGLRALSDFEYEMGVANVNRMLAPNFETLAIFCSPEFAFLSSRMVKEVAFHGGSLKGMVSRKIEIATLEKIKKSQTGQEA